MTLSNPKLEEEYNQLCALLSRRRDELSRVARDDDNAEAVKRTEELSDEIDRWHDGASKVGTTPEDEKPEVELLEQARKLSSELQKIKVS